MDKAQEQQIAQLVNICTRLNKLIVALSETNKVQNTLLKMHESRIGELEKEIYERQQNLRDDPYETPPRD